MKLILCPKCQDILKVGLDQDHAAFCRCRLSWGYYAGDLIAYYGGKAVPLGFDNSSLAKSIQTQPADGLGRRFDAFVIPRKCDTFIKLKNIGDNES